MTTIDIKNSVIKSGLMQKEFAAKIGISEQSLSLILTGKTKPSIQTMQKIYKAFPAELGGNVPCKYEYKTLMFKDAEGIRKKDGSGIKLTYEDILNEFGELGWDILPVDARIFLCKRKI